MLLIVLKVNEIDDPHLAAFIPQIEPSILGERVGEVWKSKKMLEQYGNNKKCHFFLNNADDQQQFCFQCGY